MRVKNLEFFNFKRVKQNIIITTLHLSRVFEHLTQIGGKLNAESVLSCEAKMTMTCRWTISKAKWTIVTGTASGMRPMRGDDHLGRWVDFLPAGNFRKSCGELPEGFGMAEPPSSSYCANWCSTTQLFEVPVLFFFFTNPTGSNFTAVSMIPTVVVVKAPGVLLSSASVCFPLVKPPEFSSYLHLLKHPETPLFVQVNPPLFNL